MPLQTDRVQSPEIKVAGTSLTTEEYRLLEELQVERSLWMPSRCTLRFVDPDFVLIDGSKLVIGKEVKILLPDTTGSIESVFEGEVTDIAFEQHPDRRNELVVGAMDKGHRLAAQTNIRTWAKTKYSDIVSAIARDAGLTADVTATTQQLEYAVQTTNDYEFLWEIARRIGYDWWVDAGKLCFKPSPTTAGPTLTYGVDLIEFRVRYSGVLKAKKITVQGWDPATQQPVSGDDASAITASAMPDIGSNATIATEGRSKATAAWGNKELKTGAFIATTTTEASDVAQALAQQIDATEVVARGKAYATPKLKPGTKVTIQKMGAKVSGDYYVTSVEHSWGPEPGVKTRFTAGNKQPVGLADLITAASSGAPSWGVHGLVTGVVTDIKDPDVTGRVKVKFGSLSASDTSAWARVVSFDAGSERGAQFMPEVNDEVIVGFEQGDLRYPLVLGGVWSKKNKPPIGETADQVKMRTIKTRLGHVIELSDGDGDDKKYVSITLADGKTKLNLAHDKIEMEANSKPLTIKSGQASIAFDANGGITIKGQKVTIEAQTDLALNATNIKAAAKVNAEIEGKAQLKLSGAMANLEASGIAVVKGSMVKIN